jgi:hypothetical protein
MGSSLSLAGGVGATVESVEITDGTIVNADVNASAAIENSKLEALTASEVVISNGSGEIISGAVATYPSLTELAYGKGVTSALQTQMDAKLATTAYDDATAAETDTGTATAKYVSPDSLAGSNIGTKTVQMVVVDFTTATATGDGKFYFHVPASLAGMNIVTVHAEVITAGTTNTTNIQLHNLTATADILSTVITIDSGETGSDTAAAAAVIDAAQDDLTANDVIRVDVDAVSSTPANGLIVTIECQLP